MNFASQELNGVHVITCPPHIGEGPENIEALVKSWLLMTSNIHVIDLKGVTEFNPKAYRPFVLFNQSLKSTDKKLYCMNLGKEIAPQIVKDGLDSVFTQVKSVDDAVSKSKSAAPAPAKMHVDVEFINPFITGTKVVLETQASTTLTPQKPYIKKPEESFPIEIAGVISLSSAAFTGSITLCFRAEVFLKIYENMVGEKHDKISPEIEDAAGELLNMIFGHAKTVLNDKKGHSLEKALPTILSGEKLRLRHKANCPVIVLPFESSAGHFHIEVLVEKG